MDACIVNDKVLLLLHTGKKVNKSSSQAKKMTYMTVFGLNAMQVRV